MPVRYRIQYFPAIRNAGGEGTLRKEFVEYQSYSFEISECPPVVIHVGRLFRIAEFDFN